MVTNMCIRCARRRLYNLSYIGENLLVNHGLTIKTPYSYRSPQLRSAASDSTISDHEKQNQIDEKIAKEAPAGVSSDYVGPPHSISNMPHMQFYIPEDETQAEKEFRLQRMEVLDWNHKFWSLHNERFFKEKEEYVAKNGVTQTGSKKKSLTPEEMSVFYRNFLNENRAIHANYNREWYKKNFKLLWPAVKVAFIRLRKKMKKVRPKE